MELVEGTGDGQEKELKEKIRERRRDNYYTPKDSIFN